MARREPAIVAELGRPETPEETADRKAIASARRRSNQTAFNLVVATAASLLIVLFLVFVVVRPTPPPRDPVDYQSLAAASGEAVLAPGLPDTWTANAARLETSGGIRTWAIGFITPSTQYIALEQGLEANPTWLSQAVDGSAATGAVRIAGLDWITYDRRDAEDPGNHAFSMSTELAGSTIVLHGTASDEEFESLAAAVADEAGAR
ncbi:MAG: DUF4245 domain-containing protein [Rhodoglobus sp.]